MDITEVIRSLSAVIERLDRETEALRSVRSYLLVEQSKARHPNRTAGTQDR